jgi:hypothetical protein
MRVSAGSLGVGKALDGELAQLVRRAGLTSAQTSAVIPAGTAPSLAARVRRNPNSAVTPPPTDATFPFQKQATLNLSAGYPGLIPQSVSIGPIRGPTGTKTLPKRAHRSIKRTYSHAWKQTTRQGKEMARKNAILKKECFPEGFQGSSPGQPLRGSRDSGGG